MTSKYNLAYVQAVCAVYCLILAFYTPSDLASIFWGVCAVVWAGSTVITVWATK